MRVNITFQLKGIPFNVRSIITKKIFPYFSQNSFLKLILLIILSTLVLKKSSYANINDYEKCIEEEIMPLGTTGPVSFTWGTYYGNSINTVFNDVKIDNDGNIYAFGSTISQGFDGILAKFDTSGNLLWEKFLGGSDTDNFNSDDNFDYGKLALDLAGNIYVTGITNSDDFPVVNPFQSNRGGGIDAYVAKYDSDGNLLFSSFLGGSVDENIGGAGDIAVDGNGNIFVTGTTTSNSFFNSSTSFSGGTETDIFVVKITSDFSTVTGTYWGDEMIDISRGIKIDDNGIVWVVGTSENSNLSLPGLYGNAIGGKDGIVLGWNNDLSQLTDGTFFGGIFDDEITDITIDASGDLYLTGGTYSTSDFPTANAFQSNYQGGQMAFITKITASGALTWSTFLGGSQNEIGNSIAIDTDLNVYVTGYTSSQNFPDHRTAQATFNDWTCSQDGFVFKFNSDGTQDWASYYGGWREETPTGIAVNHNNQVVIVGKTKSIDLPTSTGAHQEEVNFAGINAFAAMFEINCTSTPIIIHSTEDAIYYDKFWCSNYYAAHKPHFNSDTCALQFIAPPGYTNYEWFLNGNSLNTSGQIISANNPGSSNSIKEYHVKLNNGNSCSDASTSNPKKINWVRPMCGFGSSFNEDELPHKANILEGYDNEFFCVGDLVNFNLNADGFCEASVQWQRNFEDIPNANDFNLNVTEIGCYRVALTNNFTGCTVYSQSKRFILLDSILLNDYYAYRDDTECEMIDTLNGCANVLLKARIKSCEDCETTPNGITYEWLRDGNPISGGNNGSLNTSVEGIYTTKVSLGACEIISNPIYVSIQPTEPPIWVQPISNSICIAQQDSIILGITHPDATDSATIRFDLPYPTEDIIGYDSMVVIHDLTVGCIDVELTRLDGCHSTSSRKELHDSLTAKIDINGPACLPVKLYTDDIYSCEMDSLFWMTGDSILRATNYRANYNVQEAGDYYYILKNACGVFTSDTVTIEGHIPSPTISPTDPVCLPANISLDFPNPDSSIIIHWYKNPSATGCYTSNQYLLENENQPNLVAGQPGFYFAILEDTISGCKSLCSEKVEVQQSAAGSSLNPSNNIFFCDGDGTENVTFTVNQSSSSFTYQWYKNNVPISGETAPTYTTNEEGVYRVFLENSCDNAFTPTVSIYNIANPTLEINTPDTIYLCGPDTIRLSTNFDQPLIYQWYFDDMEITDAVDSFYLATLPGKYQIYGLNNNSQCEDWSKEVFIINSTPINLDINVTPNCTGVCSGQLEAVVTGGIPFPDGSYIYNWENGATTSTITGLCTDNYKVTITDAIGCNTIGYASVDDGFTIQSNVDSINCFAATDGSISTSITGGEAPFQYLWNTSETTPNLSQLASGSYTLTVTDALGCTNQIQHQLSAPIELNIILTKTDASCFAATDGSIQASVLGGRAPYNLTWSTPVVLDSNMLAAGNYEVTVTDNNNCEVINNISLEEPALLLGDLNITKLLACNESNDGEITVTPSGGTPPYQFLWNDGTSDSSITGLAPATYAITITDTNNCTFTDSILLNAPQELELIIDNQKNIDCNNGANGLIHTSTNGGAPPFQFYLNNNIFTDGEFDNLVAGTYEIFATDANNCITTTSTITLNQPDSLSATIITTPLDCPNTATGTTSISTTGGTGNYQYTWSNGITGNSNNGLTADQYEVIITDANGCEKIVNFEITSPVPLSTDFTIEDVKCFAGNDGSILINNTIGGKPPYTYYLEGGNLSPNNQQLDNLLMGNYTLRTVDALNCEITDQINISEPSLLEATITITDSLKCQGAIDGSLSVATIGGVAPYQILWENGGTQSINNNLAAGNYSATITDANDCQIISTMELPDGPFLELIISDIEDISCWGESDGEFTAVPQGGTAPFQFHFNQQILPSGNFSHLAEGSYSVYVTDANNCISNTQTVDIQMPDQLTLSMTSTPVLCPNGNTGIAEISPSGGTLPYQYQWDNNINTASSNNLTAGNYTVTVTDQNNCTATIDFEITEPSPMSIDFEVTNASCFEGSDGLVKIEFNNGGTPPYTHYLNGETFPQNDLTIKNLEAGIYTLITIDNHGCEISEDLIITEPPLFSFDLGEEQQIDLGKNATIPINVQNGVGAINYVFSPSDYLDCDNARLSECPSPTSILPINDIIYQVILTDENGCTAINEVSIKVNNPEENIYLGNAFNPNSGLGNNIFYVQSNASVENVIKFQIFNRWGAPIFEAANFPPNDITYGWDGDSDGKQVDVGVYIYVIEYQTIDGKIKKKMGDVTMMK